MKKLIPAIVLLLISAMIMATASYAWFSMNNKVTVSGMAVTTRVNSNLFVAQTTLSATTPVSESEFAAYLNYTTAATLLEPASTINGKTFYYADAANNVKADGSIRNATYVEYDEADTTAFVEANGVSGSVAFKDFVLELKAVNSLGTAANLRLTKLDLVYNGLPTSEKAFRAAVFLEKYNNTSYTAVSTATLPAATSIFSPSGAVNFTAGSAVNSTNNVGTVLTPNAGVATTVAANATEYYKVVIRIWLEGEDKTCRNDTFAALTNDWVLDLAFELGTETAAANILGTSGVAATASGKVGTVTLTDGKLSNNEVPATYQWYNAATKVAIDAATTNTYTLTGDPGTSAVVYCKITTTKGNVYYTAGMTLTVPNS